MDIKDLVSALPNNPGVYQYFDKEGTIIYIGKAKNLKKRVASYFNKLQENVKTRILVRKIYDIKHIVVDTEVDALLLENNLIKKHQPRYNVLLKDDKSYPWICVKNEFFPRVFYTRNRINDKSKYYGPYTSLRLVKTIIDLIKQIFKVRTCNLNLTPENIKKGKFKVCLENHIGNCKAPCVSAQSMENYDAAIANIHKILKGNVNSVIRHLKNEMLQLADEYKFENAQEIKEKINLLENYQSKSTIVNAEINDVDVFYIIDDKKYAYVNFLKVINGSIIKIHTVEIAKKLDETKEELLPNAIIDIREKVKSSSMEVLVPFMPEYSLPGIKFIVPQRGDKKHLLDLSMRNVMYYMKEKNSHLEKLNPRRHTDRILNQMKTDLRLTELPIHIECFDNSNIQGAYPVAACVVFKDAKPSKKDYRHFHIKTVVGADDFASMEEIMERRYKRLIEEKSNLPQLIVVDGGKGQLSAALKSLDKLELRGKIAIIGIAKRLEEIFFPGDSVPIYLDKNSETLKVIQYLRNEAHRFGITFHRNQRSKDFIKSELHEIKGIGSNTADKLFSELQSIANIKKATEEALAKIIGLAKAKIVFEYFKQN